MSDSKNSGPVVGLDILLTIVFLILKLTGTIGWSWWWVLSPLWLPLAVVLGIIAAIVALGLALGIIILIFGAAASIFEN
jgi:hypothetical protein